MMILKYEKTTVKTYDGFPLDIELVYKPDVVEKHPGILILGSATPEDIPFWSSRLIDEGYMLVAFTAQRPPDPDPERRPMFLRFDEAFANSYAKIGKDVPRDAQAVVDYLNTHTDVSMDKLGWVGSSSTAIPGLAVATQGPRLAAVVAFVATGAYEEWLETWKTNGLWVGKTRDLWPETRELFRYDPIKHVQNMYPTAVLMVSGGADKVVDPGTALSFVRKAAPYYEEDPDRLRLVVYEDKSHNLPGDIVTMYIEHWLHLYMDPVQAAPKSEAAAKDMNETVRRTEITGADHKMLTGSK